MNTPPDAFCNPQFPRAAGILFLIGSVFFTAAPRLKIIPGGPFISLLGEIVPICFFTAAIFASLIGFREAALSWRLAAWSICIFSAAGIGTLVDGIIRFWFRPSARGDLFGL